MSAFLGIPQIAGVTTYPTSVARMPFLAREKVKDLSRLVRQAELELASEDWNGLAIALQKCEHTAGCALQYAYALACYKASE